LARMRRKLPQIDDLRADRDVFAVNAHGLRALFERPAARAFRLETGEENRVLAIRREARHAKEGKPARIVAKMNALVEEAVIKALYAASQAGVKIDLIVRGACALRPGVKGVSDNIHVRSIIGRFLEHSRIWLFENDGAEDVYLASADWMGRNLFRRIEVAFPVEAPDLQARVADDLKLYLSDDTQAWIPKNITFVNKSAFDALDKPTQAALLKAAATAETRGWKMWQEKGGWYLDQLKAHGMKVLPPSDALKAGLKKVGDQLTADWLTKAGPDGQAVLAAYKK